MDQLNNKIHENWYSTNIYETTVYTHYYTRKDLDLDYHHNDIPVLCIKNYFDFINNGISNNFWGIEVLVRA